MKKCKLSELSSRELDKLLNRSQTDKNVVEISKNIVDSIKQQGFSKIQELSEKFDNFRITPENAAVPEQAIEQAQIMEADSLELAYKKIRTVSEAQKAGETGFESDGIKTWWVLKSGSIPSGEPLERVGIYVPSGKVPLPSCVLMAAIPAKVAGVKELVLCTPYNKEYPEGVQPGILYAAKLCDIKKIYKIGGAQAIAAMAFGVSEIGLKPVQMITGPGNQFVAAAKEYVASNYNVRQDLPAGPSEVLVIADESANPRIVAADMLSQAEHGPTSAAICLTTSEEFADLVYAEVNKQVEALPGKDEVKPALDDYSAVLKVDSIDEAIDFANSYAPEHLELCIKNSEQYYDKITAAGAVYIETGEVYGDYGMIGSTHILPTGRTAGKSSGVATWIFRKEPANAKWIIFNKMNLEKQKELAEITARFARLEMLEAHARAAEIRLEE